MCVCVGGGGGGGANPIDVMGLDSLQARAGMCVWGGGGKSN